MSVNVNIGYASVEDNPLRDKFGFYLSEYPNWGGCYRLNNNGLPIGVDFAMNLKSGKAFLLVRDPDIITPSGRACYKLNTRKRPHNRDIHGLIEHRRGGSLSYPTNFAERVAFAEQALAADRLFKLTPKFVVTVYNEPTGEYFALPGYETGTMIFKTVARCEQAAFRLLKEKVKVSRSVRVSCTGRNTHRFMFNPRNPKWENGQ